MQILEVVQDNDKKVKLLRTLIMLLNQGRQMLNDVDTNIIGRYFELASDQHDELVIRDSMWL